MKSSVKKIKDCKVQLIVEVEGDLVEARFQDVLKDFQKEAQLPGFRGGKAPLDMVEKRYTKEAEEELLKVLIPEAYHKSVAAQKVTPVCLPAISDIKLERGKKLSFKAEFELEPEFSLKNYKGIKIKKIPVDIAGEEVEKGLESLRESKAELIPLVEARAIQKGDFIVSDVEVWEDGGYKPGKKGVLLYAEPNEQDDFYDKILGAQPNEVREVSADHSKEEKEQGLVGRKPLYKVWIREVKEKKLPPMDDEFAKHFGKETVEELREAVRKDLAGYRQNESYEKMKEELFGKLSELASFPLPETLVEKQQERLLEQTRKHYARMGIPPERLDGEQAKLGEEALEKAKEQVKLYFILQKVAGEENIEIDETVLERKLSALSEESKRPIDEVRQVFEDDVRESMKEAKTIEFLLANAKMEEEKK